MWRRDVQSLSGTPPACTFLLVAGNCGDRGDATSAQRLVASAETGPTSGVAQDAEVLAVNLVRVTVTDFNRLDSN